MTTRAELRPDPEVVVTTRGAVDPADRDYARDKVAHACERLGAPVLYARIELAVHDDPADATPASAKAEVDLDGHVTRAHGHASTMTEAVDLVIPRLRRQLERTTHRGPDARIRRRRANGHGAPGGGHTWHHGDPTTDRPDWFPRPPEEREVVVRHSYLGDCMPDEAAADLEESGLTFALFVNVETGEDNVLVADGIGAYELIEVAATCSLQETAVAVSHSPVRPTTLAVDEAREVLDLTDAPFVFHLDPETGRGRVLYHRTDGHYGLLLPADAPA